MAPTQMHVKVKLKTQSQDQLIKVCKTSVRVHAQMRAPIRRYHGVTSEGQEREMLSGREQGQQNVMTKNPVGSPSAPSTQQPIGGCGTQLYSTTHPFRTQALLIGGYGANFAFQPHDAIAAMWPALTESYELLLTKVTFFFHFQVSSQKRQGKLRTFTKA